MSFHFFLSATNSLHLLTPSTWRSLSTSSSHLSLGLPLLLVPSSSWVNIFLGILSSSILSRWPNQLILCPFIHFTTFCDIYTVVIRIIVHLLVIKYSPNQFVNFTPSDDPQSLHYNRPYQHDFLEFTINFRILQNSEHTFWGIFLISVFKNTIPCPSTVSLLWCPQAQKLYRLESRWIPRNRPVLSVAEHFWYISFFDLLASVTGGSWPCAVKLICQRILRTIGDR